MNKRNIGRFWISIDLVKNNPDEVAELFAHLKIVPVRCEMMFTGDAFEYIALCPHFKEIEEGNIYPDYELMIYRNKEDVTYSVQKYDLFESRETR